MNLSEVVWQFGLGVVLSFNNLLLILIDNELSILFLGTAGII